MTSTTTIRDQNEIKLNNKWALDSKEKFVKVEGREFIQIRQPISTCEKVMEIFRPLALFTSFGLASLLVLDPFREKNPERKFTIGGVTYTERR